MAAVRHGLKDRAWRQSHPVEVLRIRTHRQAILMALGTRHISPTASTAKDTEFKDIVLRARKVASENPDVSAITRALGVPIPSVAWRTRRFRLTEQYTRSIT